jgi:hypothetical protein
MPSKKAKDDYRERHREKLRVAAAEYHTRPEVKRKAARSARKRTYGPEGAKHFDRHIKLQSGLCAVCDKPLTTAHQDHDHNTGQLRSVLCTRCNLGLGYVENTTWLARAMQYLKEWGL